MIILKCKMCGADLDPQENSTVCECDYCGTKQTIPAVDDEKKLKLYDRANRLRMNAEFDKAAGVYESIVADFDSEAEAYWGMLLCKYGIEYVKNWATGNMIPTCHRSSYDSIMDDADFELVMENAADTLSRTVYREQAKEIEEIRKGIIEVFGKEEPYDIFICYKETTEDGGRTIDSELAHDVYDALTTKGYRVFFSRITLEDKLGMEYEPYIFAALTSAKVMLAFGTSYDYYNAVWVKNEWSRFLKLMAKDKEKHLIPCYKDIDAYDMPKEFAKLQAQDLGKIGAVQDLVRGIDKLIGKAAPSVDGAAVNGPNTAHLIKRMFMFLEDGNWERADEYAEKVLDMDPENGDAYLGKFLAEQKVHNISEIGTNEKLMLLQNVISNRFGDSFEMGRFSDGKPIEWIRLITENGKSLLFSKFVLEKRSYHEDEDEKDVTWKDCDLRSYLNQDFLNKVFNDDEQERILKSRVNNTERYKGTSGPVTSDVTNDKLFLLSIDEVRKYLASDAERIGISLTDHLPTFWWLRSPGSHSYSASAASVINDGSVYTYGLSVDDTSGIRPAFWIKNSDLASLIF